MAVHAIFKILIYSLRSDESGRRLRASHLFQQGGCLVEREEGAPYANGIFQSPDDAGGCPHRAQVGTYIAVEYFKVRFPSFFKMTIK